ncbi:MAG: VOC family protein [Micromonospora sp.]
MVTRWTLTIDCAHPTALAAFWSLALGYVEGSPPKGFGSWQEWSTQLGVPEDEWDDGAYLEDPDGMGPRISFLKVPEGKIAEPRTGRRMHLDVMPTGGTRDEEVVRLKGLGCD